MKFEIQEKERQELESILLRIAMMNKITYGFDIRADIKNNDKDKNVDIKVSGLRL